MFTATTTAFVKHLDSCPLGRATDDLDTADLHQCERDPGRAHIRPVHWTESSMIDALGPPLPAAVRRQIRVHVTTTGAQQLVRVFEVDSAAFAVTAATVYGERAR